MIRNYFLTALRSFRRNKLFTAINILGLAIGISASLVIYLIVHYELNFDKFEKDNDRIYRVVIDAKYNGMEGHSVGLQAPLSNAVANAIQVTMITSYRDTFNQIDISCPHVQENFQ